MNKSVACVLQETSTRSGFNQFQGKKHIKYGPIVGDTLVPSKKNMKITATVVLKFSSQLPIRSFFTGTNGSSVADHWSFTGG